MLVRVACNSARMKQALILRSACMHVHTCSSCINAQAIWLHGLNRLVPTTDATRNSEPFSAHLCQCARLCYLPLRVSG